MLRLEPGHRDAAIVDCLLCVSTERAMLFSINYCRRKVAVDINYIARVRVDLLWL